MILILTGNFSEEESALVLKNFKERSFQKQFPRKVFPVETAKPVPLVVEEKSGIAQTYLSMGARTVCSSHQDVPTLDLMSALLSGGTSFTIIY